MMTDRELMQQALEALNRVMRHGSAVQEAKDILRAALRERLAQPEQEQKRQHDYRTRYDRGCYKCGSHYCPANCPIPAHLVRQQPEQEPVAWLTPKTVDSYMRPDLGYETCSKTEYAAFPVYTTPPRREWVGLTDEEIALVCGECAASAHRADDISYARAIEAKLKEKHT